MKRYKIKKLLYYTDLVLTQHIIMIQLTTKDIQIHAISGPNKNTVLCIEIVCNK